MFGSISDIQIHHENTENHDCDLCDKKFCNEKDYSFHQMIDHHVNPKVCKVCKEKFKSIKQLKAHKCDENTHKMKGSGIEKSEFKNILKSQVYGVTGFENEPGYKEMVREHLNVINDKVVERKDLYMKINKQINSEFTYSNIFNIVADAIHKHGKCCRINIGFGVMLRNKLSDEYRYYYVSNNNYIFNRALTISTNQDIKKLVKEVYDKDVAEEFYFRRPSSSWILAGLPNILINIYWIDIPFG